MPFADRRFAPVSDAAEAITGRPPQRFDDYLAANFWSARTSENAR
jgi:hypothetical protein